MNGPSIQFALFRIALGLFLVSHFVLLVPYAGEIYGPDGMYGSGFPSPFPNALSILASPRQTEVAVTLLAAIAALLTIGFQRRVMAVVLWYGWACLTLRIPFLYVPSEGLVGWLLLVLALVPSGEAGSIHPRSRSDWALPRGLIPGAWIVLGVGYLASGFDKLTAPSWVHGTAMRTVLTGPIGRWDAVARFAQGLPEVVIRLSSWAVVGFEVGFVGLIFSRWTRPWVWVASTTFHLLIRATLNLHTVTDPFLVAQILVFDPGWGRRIASLAQGRRSKVPLRTM